MAKRKNTENSSLRRKVFLANIVLLIGIISLTVYDVSIGESPLDGAPKEYVLSAQDEAPTPTFVPYITPTNTP
jgi:hypothetical protein